MNSLIRFLAAAVISCGAALAAAEIDVPSTKPEAVVDLATVAGVALVQGAWRYSDTRIVESRFHAAGADGQPGTVAARTYDYEPRAGGPHFDDSAWEIIDPTTLDRRRGNGRVAFNWYRINITVPERVGASLPPGRRWYSKPRSMITPKCGSMANCRGRRRNRAARWSRDGTPPTAW